MKNFSFDELRALLSDARGTENKKTLYVVLGVFAAIIAVAVGVAVVLIRKRCKADDKNMEEYWDDEEEYFDDDFEDEEKPETAE